MTIPDNTATLFEQDRATNDKVLATDAAALRVYQGHDLTLQQTGTNYARMIAEANALFTQALTQRDQLFTQALRHAEDNHQIVTRIAQEQATIGTKTLDKDTNEINSEAVGAEVVAGLAPEIRQAIDAAVAKNVNATGTSDNAIAAAVAKAVVEALAAKG
jgi:hypothetical protein